MENNETVVDNTSVEEGSELLSDDLSVDDLLGLNSEVAPEFEDGVNHTGMRPLSEWTKHLPEDVRKHLANIRSDYTRKTQEIASMKKELENDRRSYALEKEATLNNPLARRAAQIAANEEEYDLYDPEGMKKEIERQSAKMLSEMLKPAREEIMLQQRKIALNDFKRENPELTNPEYRLEIAKMLQDRPELKLEDAFYIVKSKVDSAKSREAAKVVAAQTQGRREALQKTSNGSATVPKGSPKFRDAWEAFQYHKSQGTK
jgi:hypothetical protein